MKIDWLSELSQDMYFRLCECRNIKADIVPLTKVVKKVSGWDSERALDYMLEWLTDWNNQISLYPKNEKEYKRILKKID